MNLKFEQDRARWKSFENDIMVWYYISLVICQDYNITKNASYFVSAMSYININTSFTCRISSKLGRPLLEATL